MPATVIPNDNGPYKVSGEFKIQDTAGKLFTIKGDA
jgi:hypothetical protein